MADQVVRRGVAQHADTRRIHESAEAVGTQTDNAFCRRIEQQPNSRFALTEVALNFSELRDITADGGCAGNAAFRVMNGRDGDGDIA